MTTSRRPSKLNDQLEDRGPFETRPLPAVLFGRQSKANLRQDYI